MEKQKTCCSTSNRGKRKQSTRLDMQVLTVHSACTEARETKETKNQLQGTNLVAVDSVCVSHYSLRWKEPYRKLKVPDFSWVTQLHLFFSSSDFSLVVASECSSRSLLATWLVLVKSYFIRELDLTTFCTNCIWNKVTAHLPALKFQERTVNFIFCPIFCISFPTHTHTFSILCLSVLFLFLEKMEEVPLSWI